ncbi:MAG: hypothetical protein GY906_24185 [bacterium]|nr:hypothetical protein [bacterium]
MSKTQRTKRYRNAIRIAKMKGREARRNNAKQADNHYKRPDMRAAWLEGWKAEGQRQRDVRQTAKAA